MTQKPPQRIEALYTSTAVIIFIHGLGDDADGWVDIANQFQSAKKLPHLTWVFPNAPHHHESMTTAWYSPTNFSPIPVGKSSYAASMPASEDEEDEDDEEGILKSVDYICGLIDSEVDKGIPPERIVLGGFSQGCAVALVTSLSSRYAGKLSGVVGLSGYLPLKNRVRREFKMLAAEERKDMKIFLAHGTRDQGIPFRVYRDYKERVENMIGRDSVEAHEYENMGHVTSGIELRDMCGFLEITVP